MHYSSAFRCAPILAVAVTFTVAACDGAPDGRTAGEGGTAVVGVRTDFAGFNPVTNTAWYTDELIKHGLFTPLIRYDADLTVQPYLAESWELLGDTGVVFQLRRDVRWHDGHPVTVEDVKFTFDMAKDEATASLIGQAFLAQVRSAEVLDSFRIAFTFDRPHAQAMEDFWWAPIPRHLLGEVTPGELRNAPFNRRPIGSGPFRFVEWRANDRLVIERNPDFPEALGGPPPLDRIVFRIIPEPATLLTELLTAGIHASVHLDPDQASQVERTSATVLHDFPGRTVYFVAYNTLRPPFQDARVRRALTHALDRRQIIDGLLFGYGEPATSPIPPWSPLAPDVEPLPYDPSESARLLDAAGWRAGPDGMRRDEAGRPLRFTLLSSDAPLNRSLVEVVQGQLRGIGVDVQIRVMEFQTMLAQFRGRDYDAALANWVLDNFQVAAAPTSLFHSRWAAVEGSANRTSFADPEADRLLDAGAAATDQGQAMRIWTEFTGLVQREQPVSFLFWLDELAGSREDLGDLTMDPRGKLQGMAEWTSR